jgi:hypothetical protein
MNKERNLEILNKLKKGDAISITYGSSIRKDNSVSLLVKSKRVVNKGRKEKITFTNTNNPNGVKYYAYKDLSDNYVGFAIGDMAISNVVIKENYGLGGYMVSGGIGAYLGAKNPSSVKKITDPIDKAVSDIGKNLTDKKSYAEGGIAYVNDDFPELVDNQTYVIDGFYGASNTPTEIYVMELSEGGKWYAVRDSQNINYTNDSFYDGIDVEGIQDLETITSSQPIQYSDDLEERMVSHYGDELEERGDDYYAKGGVPEKRYSFKYVIFNDEGERERGYGKGFGSSEQEAKNNLLTRVEEGLNEGEEVMDVEVIDYAKGGTIEDSYVWVEKDNIMDVEDFEEDGEVEFGSYKDMMESLDEWNEQLDTNYSTIKEFNDGEEYRRIMTIKEFEEYKKDWLKDEGYAKGGEVSRSDMEEWFYDHDNEWQNDLEIDHQEEDTNLDLVEWAYNRYHYAKGGSMASGGEIEERAKKYIQTNKLIDKWRFRKEYDILSKYDAKNLVNEGEIVFALDTSNGESYGIFEVEDFSDYREGIVFGVEKGSTYAKGGKVYAIDIDLENGEQPRESKFQYTHNEFGLHQAKEHFNRLKKEGVYEYNDIKEPIENIQLLEVDNDNDDYRVIDSEFFAKGGKVEKKENNQMLIGGLVGVLLGIFLGRR